MPSSVLDSGTIWLSPKGGLIHSVFSKSHPMSSKWEELNKQKVPLALGECLSLWNLESENLRSTHNSSTSGLHDYGQVTSSERQFPAM
jgi:hypothetical protein